jgi:phasin family protein
MAAKKSGETAISAIEAAEGQMEATATQGFDETMTALKQGMSGAAAGFEKTQADIKTNMEKAMKTVEEVVSFGQGNVEAAIKSGQIWTSGVQDIGKTMMASAQSQMDQTMSTWKALSGVKSLKDAFDLQASLARSAMEAFVAESGKLSDASLKLTEQAMAPLAARVSVAVEKFGRVAV